MTQRSPAPDATPGDDYAPYSNGHHVGPSVTPGWWDFIRQLIIFLFGIVTLIYAIVTPGYDTPFLITGLILLGIVPIDRALERWSQRRGNR